MLAGKKFLGGVAGKQICIQTREIFQNRKQAMRKEKIIAHLNEIHMLTEKYFEEMNIQSRTLLNAQDSNCPVSGDTRFFSCVLGGFRNTRYGSALPALNKGADSSSGYFLERKTQVLHLSADFNVIVHCGTVASQHLSFSFREAQMIQFASARAKKKKTEAIRKVWMTCRHLPAGLVCRFIPQICGILCEDLSETFKKNSEM